MKAGQLRHRVTLQTLVPSQDATGQPGTTWSDTALLWADVRYVSGISTIKNDADVSLTKASIRLRYTACQSGQRVLHEGRVFAIEAVLPDARKTYIDLVCEVVNA